MLAASWLKRLWEKGAFTGFAVDPSTPNK